MKTFVSLMIACLLLIATPAFANAAPNNPPVLTASLAADGFTVTVTGTVTDENLSGVDIFVSGGAAGSEPYSVNSDGTFSITIELPPFADHVEIVAVDEFDEIDAVTLNL